MTKKLPENIQKWVDALRSGEYNQVKGTLKGKMEDGTVGFCCLGVYCEIMGKEAPTHFYGWGGYFNEGPKGHYDWLKVQIGEYVCDIGAKMNDRGESFFEIADMIEKEYLEEDS